VSGAVYRERMDVPLPRAPHSPADPALPLAAATDLNLLLVAWMVAGVQTQYQHLRSYMAHDAQVATVETDPYLEGGRIERLPLPSSVKGTLRSTRTLMRTLGGQRPDAVWSQVALPLLPFAMSRAAFRRIPIVYAIDCTPALLAGFGDHYPNITDPASAKGRLTAACVRLFFRRCAALLPWSRWAADSMIHDYDADPCRVHVVHPGVDLDRWRPADREPGSGRVELLFVGGDFERKGGPELLDAFRLHLSDRCHLHVVTQAAIEPEPHVTVHRGLRPNDGRLLELYQRSHLLVLPTRADCFSMAALEAMACGLPVVISAVGGIPEIVVDGETGAVIPPGDTAALLAAVDRLASEPDLRRRWGDAGRRRAEALFDARTQAAKTVDIIMAAARRRVAI
jgi:glycosyltransferase involved in cell wall biosynthesis